VNSSGTPWGTFDAPRMQIEPAPKFKKRQRCIYTTSNLPWVRMNAAELNASFDASLSRGSSRRVTSVMYACIMTCFLVGWRQR